MVDDFELLERWSAGDRDAGGVLLRRHFDTLMRFFYGKVGGDIEDIVQTTLLGCIEARARFRGECSFRTFLFAIARKNLLKYYRAKSRDREVDPAVSSVWDLGTSPSSAVARRERAELLLIALQRVPIDFQLALELHYWEGLAAAEIATVLDIDPGTARTRLHRGRKALRAALDQLEPDRKASERELERLVGDAQQRE